MTLFDQLKANREQILAIAKQCGLTDVRVFGSVARGEERDDSDIDILVNVIAGEAKGWETFGLPVELEEMYGRKVDMVFEKGLYHVIRERILNEAKPL